MIHSAMKYNVNVISERKMFRKKDMQYKEFFYEFFYELCDGKGHLIFVT